MLQNLPVTVEGGSVGSQLGVTEVPEKSGKKRERAICALLCVVPEQTQFPHLENKNVDASITGLW